MSLRGGREAIRSFNEKEAKLPGIASEDAFASVYGRHGEKPRATFCCLHYTAVAGVCQEIFLKFPDFFGRKSLTGERRGDIMNPAVSKGVHSSDGLFIPIVE